jgi:hypothetical protein
MFTRSAISLFAYNKTFQAYLHFHFVTPLVSKLFHKKVDKKEQTNLLNLTLPPQS